MTYKLGIIPAAGFSWTWGEDIPRSVAQIHAGQMVLPFPDFQPACVSCKLRQEVQ